MNESLETLRLIAAEKSIRLEAAADDDLPPVYADRSRFGQILRNLVGNALKFTATGGRVVVRAVHTDGAIWVESEEGRGSTFHFTLPAVPPPMASAS